MTLFILHIILGITKVTGKRNIVIPSSSTFKRGNEGKEEATAAAAFDLELHEAHRNTLRKWQRKSKGWTCLRIDCMKGTMQVQPSKNVEFNEQCSRKAGACHHHHHHHYHRVHHHGMLHIYTD
mmetsp:Transcript_25701/g.66169  ORF Transcript_25701/g.66169 Transcript_25701/m.66169 type:complete len:123 (+) Transcript_25701:139-507(+)